MRFDLFQTRADAHIRKAREYLQQANMSRIEHQIAADHHAALAAMYAQRVAWLEDEIASSDAGIRPEPRLASNKQAARQPSGLQAVLSWPRAARLDAAQMPESA